METKSRQKEKKGSLFSEALQSCFLSQSIVKPFLCNYNVDCILRSPV